MHPDRLRLLYPLYAAAIGCSGAGASPGESGGSCHVTENADGSATIVCDDGSMATVRGPAGPSGADGSPGATGPAGSDGEDVTAAQSFSCFGPVGDLGIEMFYDVALLTSGELFAFGGVSDPDVTALRSASYYPGSSGYQLAPIALVLDAAATPTRGSFELSLNRATLTATVEYLAPDAAEPLLFEMPAGSCVSGFY